MWVKTTLNAIKQLLLCMVFQTIHDCSGCFLWGRYKGPPSAQGRSWLQIKRQPDGNCCICVHCNSPDHSSPRPWQLHVQQQALFSLSVHVVPTGWGKTAWGPAFSRDESISLETCESKTTITSTDEYDWHAQDDTDYCKRDETIKGINRRYRPASWDMRDVCEIVQLMRAI